MPTKNATIDLGDTQVDVTITTGPPDYGKAAVQPNAGASPRKQSQPNTGAGATDVTLDTGDVEVILRVRRKPAAAAAG